MLKMLVGRPEAVPAIPRYAAVRPYPPRNVLVSMHTPGADVKQNFWDAKRSFAGRCAPKQELGCEGEVKFEF